MPWADLGHGIGLVCEVRQRLAFGQVRETVAAMRLIYVLYVSLSQDEVSFLNHQHSAAMITIGESGFPKPVRVGIALVDGKLWSSGTQRRARTRRLRRDPRCTLFVFDPAFRWLALETTVTILEGPEAVTQNLRLFRVMQGRPGGALSWYGGELDEDAFLHAMADEDRLIYEFDVQRSYGLG